MKDIDTITHRRAFTILQAISDKYADYHNRLKSATIYPTTVTGSQTYQVDFTLEDETSRKVLIDISKEKEIIYEIKE